MTQSAVILPYQGIWPKIHPTVFLAPGCVVVGNVTIGEHSSVWFNAVVRGDVNSVTIGARTNIQDNCSLHVTWKSAPLVIGSDVTIGHGAMVHGCAVGDG
ncbi:MAG: gamma carbonic anhydrase family protein, partial [Chlorobi bacterium]|nr:gamma carbonic anhydrase family protein [Chlorobiota bacterium]